MKITDNKSTEGIILIFLSLFLGCLFVYFTLTDKTSRDLLFIDYSNKDLGVFSVLWLIGVFVTIFLLPGLGFLQVGKEQSLEYIEETKTFTWCTRRGRKKKSMPLSAVDLHFRKLSYFWFLDGVLVPYRMEKDLVKSPFGSIHLEPKEVSLWKSIIERAQPVAGGDATR